MSRTRNNEAGELQGVILAAVIVILALGVLALVLDGLDSQLLAFVTPIILKEWQVDRVAFAPALAAALIGMSFGSGLGGMLGDRFGRRPVLIASTICFGIGTIAISLTNDIITLTAWRLVSGLAFGAATPNAFALAAEWMPHRARARAIGIMAVAVPLGGMIGAGASLFLLPNYGWRGTFVICGVVTIALAVVVVLAAWKPQWWASARPRELAGTGAPAPPAARMETPALAPGARPVGANSFAAAVRRAAP